MTKHTYSGSGDDDSKTIDRSYDTTDDGYSKNHDWSAYMYGGNDEYVYAGANSLASGKHNLDVYAEMGGGNDYFFARNCYYPATNFNIIVYGGDGQDTLDISCDDNRYHWLYGEDGDDTLLGDGGHETLYGGDGDDFLQSGAAADSLYGEAGNDVLFGGKDQDYLDGGEGNDFIDPGKRTGTDIDEVYGGEGKDIVTSGDFDYTVITDESEAIDWGTYGALESVTRVTAYGTSTALSGSPFVSAVLTTGATGLNQIVNNLMTSGVESETEVSQADYVDFLDFDEQDIFVVTSSDEFGDVRGEPSTSYGDFTLNADQTSGGNGGIVAILSPGYSFENYINNNLQSTSVSLNTALGQIFEAVDKTRMEITRDGDDYYDGDGNKYDPDEIDDQLDAFNVSSNSSAHDFFDGLEIEDGHSFYLYGAYAGRFFQGANIADTGNGTDRYIAGTDNADTLAVHGFTDYDDDAITGRLYGMVGNDLLIGAGGTDYIYGGIGSDIIIGHDSQDNLWGDGSSASATDAEFEGSDTDLFVVGDSTGIDMIRDLNHDGQGTGNPDADVIMIKLGSDFDPNVDTAPYYIDNGTWGRLWWFGQESGNSSHVQISGSFSADAFYYSEYLQCSNDNNSDYYIAASTDPSLLPTDTVDGGCWEAFFD